MKHKTNLAISATGNLYKRYEDEYYANKMKEADIYSEELLNFVLSSGQDPMEWIYTLARTRAKSKINADEIRKLSCELYNPNGKSQEWKNRMRNLQRLN